MRPNETEDTTQPWHWIVIPMMGLTVGEIFHLNELAVDCAEDGVYEFLFVAPALPITGAVGLPSIRSRSSSSSRLPLLNAEEGSNRRIRICP